MTFHSILFQSATDRVPDDEFAAPDFFVDLNLDQIVAAITAGKEEYNLKPFFHRPLRDVDAIAWRHEIMQDLENIPLFDSIKAFAQNMRAMRDHLAQAEKLHYKLQKERWFLNAVEIYCDAVTRLVDDLSVVEFISRGFRAFRDYVNRYAASKRFAALLGQTKTLAADLSAIRYGVLINGLHVQVCPDKGERDYSAEVEATFERFKQGAAKDYSFNFSDSPGMNHVEAQILDQVAKLFPDIFLRLGNYFISNRNYQDDTIIAFDRDVEFYISYLEYIAAFKKHRLNFCYPYMTQTSRDVTSDQGFDLALAGKLIGDGTVVVCNSFHLRDRERIIVVSGPNQGGKTTFARTFGQLHYLASLGCPVPGKQAQLFLFDKLFTHFEREENIGNLRGKLQDDLVRIHHIFEHATPDSIIIMNEIFTSTTLRDALVLSQKIAAKIIALDLLCVWVTFVEELASLADQTVSMISTVVPENPAQRTYQIVRRPADGLAYAMSIAEKYRLTDTMIRERIRP